MNLAIQEIRKNQALLAASSEDPKKKKGFSVGSLILNNGTICAVIEK